MFVGAKLTLPVDWAGMSAGWYPARERIVKNHSASPNGPLSNAWKSIVHVLALLSGAAVLLVACAPAGGPVSRPAGGPGTDAATGPRTLRVGILNEEPVAGIALFGGTSAGAVEPTYLYHAGLTMLDVQGNVLAHLAQKVPSLNDSDWVVTPEGRMEVTWKIRPDARWHDGTPLTADDFVLGNQVVQEPEFPLSRGRGARLISDVSAVDAQTFVIRLRSLFNEANVSGPSDFPAVPKHIIGDVMAAGDKQAVTNHPYWAREFVGLGPYKLGAWQLGSYMEGIAFDQFFLGRPKIDRLLIHYYTDPNTLVANVMSKEIDVVPGGSLKVDHALAIRDQWQPIAGGAVEPWLNKFRQIDLQRRDTSAPWVRDLRVRQAMAHGIDRQTLVDTVQAGLTTPAETAVRRDDPIYGVLQQRGLTTYPFDLARAERLMAEAGWTRGADGLLRSAAGERFGFLLGATGANTAGGEAQEALAVIDQWKPTGIDGQLYFMAEDDAETNMKRALVQGGHIRSGALEISAVYENYTSNEISSEANRWRGRNRGGYSNPAYDKLYSDYLGTLDFTPRQSAAADLAKFAADDLAFIPLYYGFDIVVYRKGVIGLISPPAAQRATVWNIYNWTVD